MVRAPNPMSETPHDPSVRVSELLSLPVASVRSVVKLLAEGGSVPFIARYRKEQTGGLDEVQIRAIEEKAAYVRELVERKASILEEIGKTSSVELVVFEQFVRSNATPA